MKQIVISLIVENSSEILACCFGVFSTLIGAFLKRNKDLKNYKKL
jgi:hypothetical protein